MQTKVMIYMKTGHKLVYYSVDPPKAALTNWRTYLSDKDGSVSFGNYTCLTSQIDFVEVAP